MNLQLNWVGFYRHSSSTILMCIIFLKLQRFRIASLALIHRGHVHNQKRKKNQTFKLEYLRALKHNEKKKKSAMIAYQDFHCFKNPSLKIELSLLVGLYKDIPLG